MKTTLAALLIFISLTTSAQQYLYLQKGNAAPHTRLTLKDMVRFKTSEGDWNKGIIQEISSESITIGNVSYPLSEIEAFRTYNSLVKTIGSAAVAGGVLFTTIFLIDGLASDRSPAVTENQLILGAAFVGSGFLLRWLSRKTYEREDGWKWKVIDLNKDFNE